MNSLALVSIVLALSFWSLELTNCQQYGPPQPQPQQQNKAHIRRQNRVRPIGIDDESNMRIISKLCRPGTLNVEVVRQFFHCYSEVPVSILYANCSDDTMCISI
jgi:hypothetical protein